MLQPHADRLSSLSIDENAGKSNLTSAENILQGLTSPDQIRTLSLPQLNRLSVDVRERIIEVIAGSGGHFASPLGVVELTIALLHCYEAPKDKIVWDVGHQAYAWKILTGRNEEFPTIRQYNGLSGFLKRKESPYDAFGAGHASTSISAALGMALARDQKHETNRVVSIIGDGAMTGGMAYEALNNAGLRKTRMLVILNDNEVSISENVWVLHKMFRKAVTHPIYQRMRHEIGSFVKRISPEAFVDYAHRMEESVKGLIVPGIFFEELGLRYVGPMDGHNIGNLIQTLDSIKDHHGPVLLHVITQKGRGYEFAEKDPIKYHAAANMKIETGVMKKSAGPPALTKVFGEALVEECRRDSRIVGITAAMDSGTGLNILAKHFPERFYDVGIAEENGVTMAAGMACEGLKPVVAIYSTFLQRAIDQIIHDVALQDLNVFFVMDRGGLVGADGPTHHGVFDLSYLRMIPNLVVMASKDEVELRNMLHTGLQYNGAIALRYPRGSSLGLEMPTEPIALEIGKGELLQIGKTVALIGIGKMVGILEESAKQLEEKLGARVTVINARFVKPLDEALILTAAREHELVVTAEDNTIAGGFGSAVVELLAREGIKTDTLVCGIPDRFVDHGTPEELFDEIGLSADKIVERVMAALPNSHIN
ncbi:MAG: 1-deoxy-D-xylulose-5-phosphate synthase [Sumerlaeia bacterium]